MKNKVAKPAHRPKNSPQAKDSSQESAGSSVLCMMMHMTLDRTPSLGMQNQTGVDAPDDEALIARSRAGDVGAVRALVERHAPTVFRIAYRLVGAKAQAEDIAQDVLMRMLDYREGWLSKPGFHVWLRRAVYNRTVDIHRKQRPWAFSALDVVAETSDGAPAQDTALVARESENHVAAAVLELPLRQRMAVTLCFYEQHSLAEAAAVLKVSVGAVESLLHRAKATLKQKLLQQEG